MSDQPLVLYIEDNEDNLKLVTKVLRVAGFKVIGAVSGQIGLDYASKHLPDLILVDIHLPDMDGLTVTARLRENAHIGQTPIIALTANVTHVDHQNSVAAGCTGFIEKPIDVDRLPDQIHAYLSPQTT